MDGVEVKLKVRAEWRTSEYSSGEGATLLVVTAACSGSIVSLTCSWYPSLRLAVMQESLFLLLSLSAAVVAAQVLSLEAVLFVMPSLVSRAMRLSSCSSSL